MRDLREVPENYKDLTWDDYKNIDPVEPAHGAVFREWFDLNCL